MMNRTVPPDQLPGTSAGILASRLGRLIWGEAVVFALVYAMIQMGVSQGVVGVIVVGSAIAFVPSFVVTWTAMTRRTWKEHAAGYTTVRTVDRRLWVLDMRTGAVIRAPEYRPQQPRVEPDAARLLDELSRLREAGAISAAEYEESRRRITASAAAPGEDLDR